MSSNHLTDIRNDGNLAQRLAALPDDRPAMDIWPVLEALSNEPGTRQGGYDRVWYAAVAAVALIVLALPIAYKQLDTAGSQPSAYQEQVASWRDTSNLLAQVLDISRSKNQVLSAERALAIADLEDRISVLDYELSSKNTGAELELWEMRTELMAQLVIVNRRQTDTVAVL